MSDQKVPVVQYEDVPLSETPTDRIRLPGNCEAFYIGDPSHDVLRIDNFNVNPLTPSGTDNIKLTLKGCFISDPGPDVRYRLTLSRHGVVRLRGEAKHLNQSLITVRQEPKTDRDQMGEGGVEIFHSVGQAVATAFQRGFYTLRLEMWSCDGRRITDFDATIWLEGLEQDLPGMSLDTTRS